MDEGQRKVLMVRKRELIEQRGTVIKTLPGIMRGYVEQMDESLLRSDVGEAEKAFRIMTKMLKRRRGILSTLESRIKILEEKLAAE